MIKRTIFITNPVSLSVKNKQLVINNKETAVVNTIPIVDIGFVVIENNLVYITIPTINELSENNAVVIFCNNNHMPTSMNLSLDCNSIQNQVFASQINAGVVLYKKCWKTVVEKKITNQIKVLEKYGIEHPQMNGLANDVKSGDTTNREAVAAKYYWSYLMGKEWHRERIGAYPNNMLNYGYAILRAATARALVGSGLLPTIGIHHHNKYNAFALADDIMEPYRPYVDDMVVEYKNNHPEETEITKEFKVYIMSLLTRDTHFKNSTRPLMLGLSHTSSSLVKVFQGSLKTLVFPSLE